MSSAQQPFLPTLYKARRVPTKQVVCAICVERTRGRTSELRLGYGVSVWLCEGHGSQAFQTQRGGRDLVLTLERLWRAHGCLTAARHKALRAHLAACAGAAARPRPGSYSWPALRTEAEEHFSAGAAPYAVIRHLRGRHETGPARPPSIRTMRRWCAERRWLARAPQPGSIPSMRHERLPEDPARGRGPHPEAAPRARARDQRPRG